MEKCLFCRKEIPSDKKMPICEHCIAKTAEGFKKTVIGAAAIGLTVLAVFTKGKIGPKGD